MKQSITISLDCDIVANLKQEENYSNTINEQLKAFYNVKQCKNLQKLQADLQESLQELKKKRKKVKEIKENIAQLRENERKTLDLLNKNIYSVLTKGAVEELRKINNLDYDTALKFAEKNNLIKRGIGGIKLIKLWEEIKNVRTQN